jgi:peptidoglycan-associated lipoprotein
MDMKGLKLANLLAIGALLVFAEAGCKRSPTKGVTPIPGTTGKPSTGREASRPIGDGNTVPSPISPTPSQVNVDPGTVGTNGVPLPSEPFQGMNQDPGMFKANTVLFDFDSWAIKKDQRAKIEEVGNYLKGAAMASNKLLIEGHCDERGTEEYNRALGERRALAIREYLVRFGVAANRLYTRSWGEDRPAIQGHDEAAWSKNRRGEFVVLTPQ